MLKIQRRKAIKLVKFAIIVFIASVFILLFIAFGAKKTTFFLNGLNFGSSQSKGLIVNPIVVKYENEAFKEKLKNANFSFNDVKGASLSSDIIFKIENGPIVVFSRDKDIDWQISSLQSIISRLTIESRAPKKIDFRFDKPVVNFN